MHWPPANICRRFVLLLRLAVLVFLLEGQMRDCNAQEASLKERFLAEAPGKIDEYAKYCRRLQGNATLAVDMRYRDGKKTHTVNQFGFKQNAHCASFLNDFESADQKWKKLSAVNSDYSFQLKWAEAGNAWVVTTIEGPESTLEMRTLLPDVVLNRIMPQYHFGQFLLSDILRSSEFVVERAEPVTQDGLSLARITFTYRQQKKPGDRGYCPVHGGVILLAPEHYWRPLERNLDYEWVNGTGAGREQFEYSEEKNGFYIIKRHHKVHRFAPFGPDSPGTDDTWEYDLHEASRLPSDSEFTLTAYGLPEPPHLRRPTPWYLWVLGGGAVCFVLGFLVHRRIRRGN